MKSKPLTLIFSLGFVLLSCSASPPLNFFANNPVLTANQSEQGQILPITAKAIVGGEIIELEVAETPEQQAIGLMYRSHLPKNRGMLFPFSPARVARFWMKNTLIPLDIIFLEDGVIKAIFANVSPCQVDPCPVYGPSFPINQVIEIPAGRAKELGLSQGDEIILEFLETP